MHRRLSAKHGWLHAAWLACAALLGSPPAPAHAAPGVRSVGTLVLTACAPAGAYCGILVRPLDPLGQVPGSLAVGFEYYPHTGRGEPRGTLVATEGGPGYPARESREDYLGLFRPLMRDHDVLIMDNRGTGTSGALDCPSLQRADASFTIEAVAACGDRLGPAAWLYSTSYAADDLAALLDALGVGQVDLYGDSYGTYTAQTFAVRHPSRLRTLVLDGAYPLLGEEPGWYPTYAASMRAKFDTACARSPQCAALPGTSIARIGAALDQLRRTPLNVQTHDADGTVVRYTMDAQALATAMYGGAPALAVVRELDAAARALRTGDPAPLARLLGEAHVAVDSRDATYDPRAFSSGLAAAIMCGDAPQIYDMTLAPGERRAARDRVIAERQAQQPDAYAPFTYDEYRSIPLDYAFLDECVLWPAIEPTRERSIRVPADSRYPEVPVLVVSGELDAMTTMDDGAAVAHDFAHARQVVIANSFHVNALARARSACGARIVRRFIQERRVVDDCSTSVPPVRLVPAFATRSGQVDAAVPQAGTAAPDTDLRLAAATVATVGDVLVRVRNNTSGTGTGLRAGTYTVHRGAGTTTVTLDAVRWTNDLAVSGTVRLHDRDQRVVAAVRLESLGVSGELAISWNEGTDRARAAIAGRVDGRALRAYCDAP